MRGRSKQRLRNSEAMSHTVLLKLHYRGRLCSLVCLCAPFPQKYKSIFWGPLNIAKAIVYAQRFVASNNATHSCDKSHNRWLCPLRSISANASACFSLRLRSARRGSHRRWHGIAAQSPRKEKEPDKIRFVFFICGGDEGVRSKQRLRNSEVSEFTRINAAPARRGSRRRRHGIAAQSPRKEKEPDKIGFIFFSCGGDEGGRTPYLLNAIQALYQLSYTPKADNKRKYTIFTSFCQLHLNK